MFHFFCFPKYFRKKIFRKKIGIFFSSRRFKQKIQICVGSDLTINGPIPAQTKKMRSRDVYAHNAQAARWAFTSVMLQYKCGVKKRRDFSGNKNWPKIAKFLPILTLSLTAGGENLFLEVFHVRMAHVLHMRVNSFFRHYRRNHKKHNNLSKKKCNFFFAKFHKDFHGGAKKFRKKET